MAHLDVEDAIRRGLTDALCAELRRLAAAGERPALVSLGRSWLHAACASSQLSVVQALLQYPELFSVHTMDANGAAYRLIARRLDSEA